MTSTYDVELVTTQFQSALELFLQQTDSVLRGSVKVSQHVGKAATAAQYIGEFQFKDAGPRGSTLIPQEAQYGRRWLFPADKDLTVHVDSFDKLRTIVDPESAISQATYAAANRLFDDVVILGAGNVGGFFGTAKTGPDPANLSDETFDSGAGFPKTVTVSDTFGAGTSVGLTAKKIIEGRRILRQYHNNMSGATVNIAIGNQEEADLLNQLEVISTEYRARPVYDDDGKIGRFLGCNFHYSERLQTASNLRSVPMWLSDGMELGIWKDLEVMISRRTDITSHPWQMYAMVTLGSTRLQPGKVVKISCADTQGGDITV